MGWKFTYGLDMSGYKYLVLKLDKVQKVGACIMLYTENNIWSDCCQYPVGGEVLVAVPFMTSLIRVEHFKANRWTFPVS